MAEHGNNKEDILMNSLGFDNSDPLLALLLFAVPYGILMMGLLVSLMAPKIGVVTSMIRQKRRRRRQLAAESTDRKPSTYCSKKRIRLECYDSFANDPPIMMGNTCSSINSGPRFSQSGFPQSALPWPSRCMKVRGLTSNFGVRYITLSVV